MSFNHPMSRFVTVVAEENLDRLKEIGFIEDKGMCKYTFPISSDKHIFECTICISGDYVSMIESSDLTGSDREITVLWNWDYAGCISIEELSVLSKLLKKGKAKEYDISTR